MKVGFVAVAIATSSCLIGSLVGYMIGTASRQDITVETREAPPFEIVKNIKPVAVDTRVTFNAYLKDAAVVAVEYEPAPRLEEWKAAGEKAREIMEMKSILCHYTYADLADQKTGTIVTDILSTVTHTPVVIRLPSMEIHRDKTILN